MFQIKIVKSQLTLCELTKLVKNEFTMENGEVT